MENRMVTKSNTGFAKKTVRDVDVKQKRVLVRVDYNVPTDSHGNITDDSRIRASLPTVKYLVQNHACTILCSHFGRPKGKVVESMRLEPIANRLSALLGQPVKALKDCIGPGVESEVKNMKEGETILLENLRFYPEEEANDPKFAKALAQLADIYVDDAFGSSHRAHASVVGVAGYLPAVAGFLMQDELEFLGSVLRDPAHPFVAVMGGAKVSDKLGVIQNILSKMDVLLIGGGMAATFLKAKGLDVGSSQTEDDRLDYARLLFERASSLGVKMLIPTDVVIAQKLEADVSVQTVPVGQIPQGWLIADVGPNTINQYIQELRQCKTALWNGPMGVFEIKQFAQGTENIAREIAGLKATTIVGGGSTAEAIAGLGLWNRITHVSTGGGASLEFLEGKVLPGVAVLQDK